MVKRPTYIYIKTMETALKDNVITKDESNILTVLKRHLGISYKMEEEIELRLRESKKLKLSAEEEKTILSSGDKEKDMAMYRDAVLESLADYKISQDEFMMLSALRQVLNISEEEHTELESSMRKELEEKYSASVPDKILDRLTYYFTMIKKSFI